MKLFVNPTGKTCIVSRKETCRFQTAGHGGRKRGPRAAGSLSEEALRPTEKVAVAPFPWRPQHQTTGGPDGAEPREGRACAQSHSTEAGRGRDARREGAGAGPTRAVTEAWTGQCCPQAHGVQGGAGWDQESLVPSAPASSWPRNLLSRSPAVPPPCLPSLASAPCTRLSHLCPCHG